MEIKDHRYKFHRTEIIRLRKRDPPTSLRIQYPVQKDNQIRKNRKVNENNGKLEVKNYPKKKQPNIQQKLKPPNCPSFKRHNWLEFDKCYYCKNCEHIINKQKHKIDKKVQRQDKYFSTRLPYANKHIREIWMNMVNTTYNSTEDMINKLQELKGKTKIRFYINISKYYDEMNIRNYQFEEDSFGKNAQGIIKT